jgi:hypothetical protein
LQNPFRYLTQAHPYGTNRAYPTAKDGPSRSRSRADQERAPRRRGALQTETGSEQGNASERPRAGRATAAQTAHPGDLASRAGKRRGGRNTRKPQPQIPASRFARIRTWVKYGMTVADVAQVYGVAVEEIEGILRDAG